MPFFGRKKILIFSFYLIFRAEEIFTELLINFRDIEDQTCVLVSKINHILHLNALNQRKTDGVLQQINNFEFCNKFLSDNISVKARKKNSFNFFKIKFV